MRSPKHQKALADRGPSIHDGIGWALAAFAMKCVVRLRRAVGRQATMKQPAVYIMASCRNGTLYTGVTSNLPRRAFEHRERIIAGFTRRYGCKMLVWYELHDTMVGAISREKQIKGGSRRKKLALIEADNREWRDLFGELM
jgi:predicted GIY-YIG superfamily endonuclease